MAPSPAPQQSRPAESHWTDVLVIAELEDAFRTLRALPSGGHSQQKRVTGLGAALEMLGGAASAWPAEPGFMRPPAPSPRAIDRMDETLRWVGLIPQDKVALRRIVSLRAVTTFATGKPAPWTAVARQVGCDPAAAKVWHAQAIAIITRRLNAGRVPVPREPGRR